VTQLLLAAARHDHAAKLCILGAGNGNDLDLSLLVPRYGKVTLVDLDADALQHAAARVSNQQYPSVETIAGVDLSGILDLLAQWPGQPLPSQTIDQAVKRLSRIGPTSVLGRYDVVASTCLLSQMIDSVVERLGPDHPQLVEVTLTLRDSHLKLLRELTVASGTALLITDFVSSDTLPSLSTVTDQSLEGLLVQAIDQRNFFTGLNPAVLAQRLGDASVVGGRAVIELSRPWRWQLGDRTFAVAAISMTKGQ
jgi:hypothetical protein